MRHAVYVVMFSLILSGFCGQTRAESGLVEKGKALIKEKHCTICHKEGGKGKSLDLLAAGCTDAHLKESILHPKETMGPKTLMPTYEFTDQEIEAVIEYLRSISQP